LIDYYLIWKVKELYAGALSQLAKTEADLEIARSEGYASEVELRNELNGLREELTQSKEASKREILGLTDTSDVQVHDLNSNLTPSSNLNLNSNLD